jgi:hypothetical protein
VAADSADSTWQQALTAFATRVPDASGPWQQPADAGDSPGSTGPRWQKQRPAEASSNAMASTATPNVLRN